MNARDYAFDLAGGPPRAASVPGDAGGTAAPTSGVIAEQVDGDCRVLPASIAQPPR